MSTSKNAITVFARIKCPMAQVWEAWTTPKHIMQWNNASPDWHTPHAENDLRVGGSFSSRMESKDGKFGFDFGGVYTNVIEQKLIEYELSDKRKISVNFVDFGNETEVTEIFDPEEVNPYEMQKAGWQAILDNFKRHAEALNQ